MKYLIIFGIQINSGFRNNSIQVVYNTISTIIILSKNGKNQRLRVRNAVVMGQGVRE